ncbi:MAG TPA: class I SAM-dependent methyltransferase [Tepidisphaeraceae bacterium]|nr:class I SAM-dependent methyltransferase [Tepidisphaeraceae bacterium]
MNSPISDAKADRLVRWLGLAAGQRVWDAGCGAGEFLLRAVAACDGVAGLGVDQDATGIAAARAAAAARGLATRCAFREGDANAPEFARGEYDVAICIGSTHAFGAGEAAYPSAIARLRAAVRPGGLVLIGEAYWKQPPAPEYLALLGDPAGIYRDHAGNVAFAEARGLTPVYATTSTDDEWDEFEWSHQARIRQAAEAAKGGAGPDGAARLARAKAWRDGYLRWGRATMGFGAYVFRRQ